MVRRVCHFMHHVFVWPNEWAAVLMASAKGRHDVNVGQLETVVKYASA